MYEQYKISVAMTTYNGATYLGEMLDSLLSQSVIPDEIIVVDDCSQDETLNVLSKYALLHNCIKVYANDKNKGVNRNFEKAVSLCDGDFIFLCDQDDVWFVDNIKEKVEILKTMPEDQMNFVACLSLPVNEKLKPLVSSVNIEMDDSENPYEMLFTPLQGTCIGINKKFARNIVGWPSNFNDFPYDGYLRFVGVLSANMYLIGKPLMYYRIHSNNVIGRESGLKRHGVGFQRYKLTLRRIKWIKELLNILPVEVKQKERCENVHRICECANNRMFFFKFLFMSFLPFKIRLKLIVNSLVGCIK